MDKKNIIIALLVVNLVVLVYYGSSLGKRSSELTEIVNMRYNDVQNRLGFLEQSIISGIAREWEVQREIVSETNYRLKDADLATKMGQLELSVSLKEIADASEVYMTYGIAGGSLSNEVRLTSQGGMVFGATVPLSLEHNYEYNVWEQSGTNGKTLLTTSVKSIPLYDEFYVYRVSSISTGKARSKETMSIDFSFSIRETGIIGTELDKAFLKVWDGSVLVDERDITADMLPGSFQEAQDRYNVAIASGEIDSSVSLGQFMEDNGIKPGEPGPTPQYSYRMTLQYATDYPELALNMEKANELRFQLVFKFKDGYEYSL